MIAPYCGTTGACDRRGDAQWFALGRAVGRPPRTGAHLAVVEEDLRWKITRAQRRLGQRTMWVRGREPGKLGEQARRRRAPGRGRRRRAPQAARRRRAQRASPWSAPRRLASSTRAVVALEITIGSHRPFRRPALRRDGSTMERDPHGDHRFPARRRKRPARSRGPADVARPPEVWRRRRWLVKPRAGGRTYGGSTDGDALEGG